MALRREPRHLNKKKILSSFITSNNPICLCLDALMFFSLDSKHPSWLLFLFLTWSQVTLTLLTGDIRLLFLPLYPQKPSLHTQHMLMCNIPKRMSHRCNTNCWPQAGNVYSGEPILAANRLGRQLHPGLSEHKFRITSALPIPGIICCHCQAAPAPGFTQETSLASGALCCIPP